MNKPTGSISNIPSHLLPLLRPRVVDEEPSAAISEKMKGFINQIKRLDEKIQVLEQQLKRLSDERRAVLYNDMPMFLIEQGMSEFTSTDGVRYEMKNYVSARVEERKKEEFLDWLAETGRGDLIRKDLEVSVKDYDLTDLMKYLEGEKLSFSIKQGVHPQTLNAMVRRALVSGEKLPEGLMNIDSGNYIKVTK